ncbi:cytochrome c5 family protein [Legionella israelensis]|uniref:Cytochrome c5 family protein n=1 Tax=Legionella israelensis TaxID=454 RepID=A0AAX1EIV5_9GAMM|nr:c-type cytochrome [Legionella israelensis]QBR85036.1 cytochrome c5 family protein [Legionella israelensis]
MRIFVAYFILLISVSINVAAQDYERTQIEQRIKPVGQVRIKKETGPAQQKKPDEKIEKEQTKKKQEPGQKIYEQYCMTCHKGGLAGAPKFRNQEDWKSKTAEKNIDELTAVAIKGINAMPPKGTCMECSEADIKAAIEYMLPNHD